MNDFTKEDLLKLYDYVWAYERINHQKDEILLNKINSMINNYCEHEFYVNGCGENVFAQCHKCGEIARTIRKDTEN